MMKNVQYSLILMVLTFVLSAHAHSEETVIWIDVRSAEEFSQEHIAGAHLVPHDEISDRIGMIAQDRNQQIYLYCRSGRRSGIAQKKLQKLGYTNAVNVGGLKALKRQGHPTQAEK